MKDGCRVKYAALSRQEVRVVDSQGNERMMGLRESGIGNSFVDGENRLYVALGTGDGMYIRVEDMQSYRVHYLEQLSR